MKKKEYTHVSQPFKIVMNHESETLILGSFPSVKSRELGFYYMNPRNRFWKVMSCLLGGDLFAASTKEKIDAFLKNHLALYDVIIECDIIASYDDTIKNVKYLDIRRIISESKINRIICNGSKAYNLFIKEYPNLRDMVIKLPSTSPANAKCSFLELVERWEIITQNNK